MKNKKMMIGREVLIGLIVLICISNISAFAISSAYWRENPLILTPGESKEFFLTLQNLGATSDLNLRAVVTTGSSVLRLAGSSNIYTIPAGQMGEVNFIATLPADSKPGQIYSVQINFAEVKDSQSGEFGFGTAIGQSFDIIAISPVKEPTKTPLLTVILLAVGVALLVAIILILGKKLKKKKSHGKHRKRKGRR